MTTILIQPPQLRTTAQTLRQGAKTISNALTNVETLMADLNSYSFAGNRASAVRSRFSQIQSQLINASTSVTKFAQELETSADVFEKADLQNISTSPAAPTPTPAVTPIKSAIDQFMKSNGTSGDFQKLIDTLLAISPLILQGALDTALGKAGLDILTHIKDVYDLLRTGKGWNDISLAQTNLQNAASQFGENSAEAIAAQNNLTTAWENAPFIGDIIKAAIEMGNANPVISE